MSIMESVYYPFSTLHEAIRFLNSGNPARAKYPNIFEDDRGSKPSFDPFSGGHPNDIYASTVAAFEEALSNLPGYYQRMICVIYWRRDQAIQADPIPNPVEYKRQSDRDKIADNKWSVKWIASKLGMKPRTARYHLDRFNERLTEELRRRQLLRPQEH